jgi:hypothetical protein
MSRGTEHRATIFWRKEAGVERAILEVRQSLRPDKKTREGYIILKIDYLKFSKIDISYIISKKDLLMS